MISDSKDWGTMQKNPMRGNYSTRRNTHSMEFSIYEYNPRLSYVIIYYHKSKCCAISLPGMKGRT